MTLGGVFYGVKHAARQMLDQGHGGVIINILSMNARQPGEGQMAYCAAKAGVDMITRCGALELGSRGTRVVGNRGIEQRLGAVQILDGVDVAPRRVLRAPSFELKLRVPLRPLLCWPRRQAGRAFQPRTDRR